MCCHCSEIRLQVTVQVAAQHVDEGCGACLLLCSGHVGAKLCKAVCTRQKEVDVRHILMHQAQVLCYSQSLPISIRGWQEAQTKSSQ